VPPTSHHGFDACWRQLGHVRWVRPPPDARHRPRTAAARPLPRAHRASTEPSSTAEHLGSPISIRGGLSVAGAGRGPSANATRPSVAILRSGQQRPRPASGAAAHVDDERRRQHPGKKLMLPRANSVDGNHR